MPFESKRIPLIAANWKMNFTAAEAEAFVQRFKQLVAHVKGVDIAICASFPSLPVLKSALSGSSILLGAQNVCSEEEGTFTGEVSAKMLAQFCSHVIVGHSERRAIFKETNQETNRKTKKALQHGLTPIVCIGETLDERNSGKTNEVLEKMFKECYAGLSAQDALKTIIAYEPVWAISKGKLDIAKSQAATPETAEEAHALIRSLVASAFGKDIAEQVRILYGGSMKPENVRQLMAQKDIDGGLVGGASLDPDSLAKVVKFKEE